MSAGRVVRRLLVAILVAAFAAACIRLGWWQWQRYHSPGGSLQNLGYTLQWPTFALFAIFLCWRLSRLEAARRRRPAAQPEPEREPQPGATPEAQPEPAARSTGEPGDDQNDELAAYNAYLAQLHAKERNRVR